MTQPVEVAPQTELPIRTDSASIETQTANPSEMATRIFSQLNQLQIDNPGVDLRDEQTELAFLTTQLSERPPFMDTIEASTRQSDPRDFIPSAKIEKIAQEIDPEHSSWEGTGSLGPLFFKSEDASLAAGMIKKPGQELATLKIAGTSDAEGFSEVFEEIPLDTATNIISILKTTSIYLSKEEAFRLAKEISLKKDLLTKASPTEVTGVISEMAIGKTRSINSAEGKMEINTYDQAPSPEQIQLLSRTLDLAATKLAPDKLQALREKIDGDLRWVDNYFGEITFGYSLGKIAEFVLENHPDAKPDFATGVDYAPKRFPIEMLARRRITTQDQMVKILGSMPVIGEFTYRGKSRSETTAEFVDIERVIGGGFDRNFLITDRTRDQEYLFKMIQAAQTGRLDISGSGSMQIKEYNGNYFMEQDGRHRIAVMKALGIPFAPMLVTHYKDLPSQN